MKSLNKIFCWRPLAGLGLLNVSFALSCLHVARGQEGWLYVAEYPYVWSDSGQEWLHFEHPSQPAYVFSSNDWPVFFDEISLEQLAPPTQNHLILMHSGPHWMLIRFNKAEKEGPAQIFEFAESEPVMEGSSHYVFNDRKNTMLLTVLLEHPETEGQIAASIHMDYVYQDGGWFSMTGTLNPGPESDQAPSPIAGFLPDSTGGFWFYSEAPQQLPEGTSDGR